jgi:hypothetical protein
MTLELNSCDFAPTHVGVSEQLAVEDRHARIHEQLRNLE